MKKTLLLCLLATVCVLAGENLLNNPDFRTLDQKGIPHGWFIDGKTQVEIKDGSLTLSLPEDRGKQSQATIMQHLADRLVEGHSYRFTAKVSAPRDTTAMLYFEGTYYVGATLKWWMTDGLHLPVPAQGTTREIVFAVPAQMERIYVSLRTVDANVPVTFSDLNLEEIHGGNLVQNADFTALDDKGVPVGWSAIGKTIAAVKNGAVTLSLPPKSKDNSFGEIATLMQNLTGRLPEGMVCTLSAHVSAPSPTNALFFIQGEYQVNKQRLTMRTDGASFPVDNQGTTRRLVFTVPGKMNKIHLCLQATDSAIPVTFSKVRLAVGNVPLDDSDSQNLLTNPDFAELDAKGVPSGWFSVGKTVAEVKDGALTLSLPADRGDQTHATLMQHLAGVLQPGKTYILTGNVSAATSTNAQLYVEGQYHNAQGESKGFLTKDFSFPVDAKGSFRRIKFTVPGKMDRIYISVRAMEPDKPVTFRGLGIHLVEEIRDMFCGGYWENRFPGSPADGLTLPAGKSTFLRQIPVKPGKTYRLTYQISGSGDTGSEDYDFYDYKITSHPVLVGGLSFQRATAQATAQGMTITVPEIADCKAIDLSFTSQTFGELKLSDIKFEEGDRDVTEGWTFLLTEPCYRNTIHERTDTGFVAGEIIATPPAATAKINIDGLAALTIPLTDGKGQFRVKADHLSLGSYPAICRVEDANGALLKQFQLTLRKIAPAPHEVLIDKHQSLLVDGKPFFPVVEYRTAGTDALKGGLYHRARHGINTLVLVNLPSDEERNLAFLDRLASVGMKAIIEIWAPSSVTTESKQHFRKHFNALMTPAMRQHPALLAYFTNDEPFACYRNPAPLIWSRAFLEEADPYHPVWIGQSPRDVSLVNLRPYADGSDITGIDIYPAPPPQPQCDLPDKSLNCVGEYTRLISEVVYHRKPVWMTVQAFEWHDHNFPQDTRRSVYPTEDETRFMAFDALFNGSRALVLYGTTKIKSLPYRRLIDTLAEELTELSGLLAHGEPLPDLPTDTPKVRLARRRHGENVYLGIFNQEPLEKELTFAAEKPLIIYREGRRLVPRDGKITVKLRPHEIIICGETRLPPRVNTIPPCNPELEDAPNPILELIRKKNEI